MHDCWLAFPKNFPHYPSCSVFIATLSCVSGGPVHANVQHSPAGGCPALLLGTLYPCKLCGRDRLCGCSILPPFYFNQIWSFCSTWHNSCNWFKVPLKICVVFTAGVGGNDSQNECNTELGRWGPLGFRVWWNSSFRLYLWPSFCLNKIPGVTGLVKKPRAYGFCRFWVCSFEKTQICQWTSTFVLFTPLENGFWGCISNVCVFIYL